MTTRTHRLATRFAEQLAQCWQLAPSNWIMYFIIGLWGHERRFQSALKFFLFTRVGSLAVLLSIVALYLGTNPHTFDLPTIIAACPYAGTGVGAFLVLLGFLIGFGIKLPVVPLHSWLPDAHTDAPTEAA